MQVPPLVQCNLSDKDFERVASLGAKSAEAHRYLYFMLAAKYPCRRNDAFTFEFWAAVEKIAEDHVDFKITPREFLHQVEVAWICGRTLKPIDSNRSTPPPAARPSR